MAAQPSQPRLISVDEWRELEPQSYDIKHEDIDGHVYALAGGTLAHGSIADNAMIALSATLATRACRVYRGADVAVCVSPTCYTSPDMVVTCG